MIRHRVTPSCVCVCSLQLTTWLGKIGEATLNQYTDMGTNLSTSRDFLEVHERLDEDIRVSRYPALKTLNFIFRIQVLDAAWIS